jgi:hypothetical protein
VSLKKAELQHNQVNEELDPENIVSSAEMIKSGLIPKYLT